ncbi:MAG: NIF family HAD-type phosphatase [bacterium]|nr:NIF family HAD-type phosphatase [bacterium]
MRMKLRTTPVAAVKRKSVIILDLDRTLFDTEALKKDTFAAVKACGHSVPAAKRIAKETFCARGFSPRAFVHALVLDAAQKKKLLVLLNAIFARAEEYWYEGVDEFLDALKKDYVVMLLSYGNGAYQRKKIINTRFEKLFDRICITGEKEKERLLRTIAKTAKSVVFLDDSLIAIETARRLSIHAIRVKKTKKDAAYFETLVRKIKKLIE